MFLDKLMYFLPLLPNHLYYKKLTSVDHQTPQKNKEMNYSTSPAFAFSMTCALGLVVSPPPSAHLWSLFSTLILHTNSISNFPNILYNHIRISMQNCSIFPITSWIRGRSTIWQWNIFPFDNADVDSFKANIYFCCLLASSALLCIHYPACALPVLTEQVSEFYFEYFS